MIKDPDRMVQDFHTRLMVPRRSIVKEPERCAGCGKPAFERDNIYSWYVCADCDADEVADDFARDAMM